MQASSRVEGAGSKPLSVPDHGDRIQLSVLPVPRRAASTGLSGLAPMRMLVPSTTGQPPPLGFTVHTPHRSFLWHGPGRLQPPVLRSSALRRGDFPQGRTLSAVLLLPPDRPRGSWFQDSVRWNRSDGTKTYRAKGLTRTTCPMRSRNLPPGDERPRSSTMGCASVSGLDPPYAIRSWNSDGALNRDSVSKVCPRVVRPNPWQRISASHYVAQMKWNGSTSPSMGQMNSTRDSH